MERTPFSLVGRSAGIVIGIICTLIVVGTMVVGSAGVARSQGASDPSREEVPELDTHDSSMAVTVDVLFNSRTSVDLKTDPRIVESRARAHVGEPGILRIDAFDHQGDVIASYNSWHPMWTVTFDESGHEETIVLEGQVGEVLIPFSAQLATLGITDVAYGQQVFEVDLDDTFIEFCQANPNHEACVTDLALGMSGTPTTAMPGQIVEYVISVENSGPNPARLFQIVDTLPEGVSYVRAKDATCVQNPSRVLTCRVDEALAVGDGMTMTIVGRVEPFLEVPAGEELVLRNEAKVELLAGTDTNKLNDVDMADTVVVK